MTTIIGQRRLQPFEQRQVRTPIAQQRAALAELGAPLAKSSLGADEPRRGMMRA